MAHSPLAQFEIKTLAPLEIGGFDVSFTNSSAFMVAIVLTIWLVMMLGMRQAAVVPGRMQALVEELYEFVRGIVTTNVGKDGLPFFPLIFSVFTFILVANLAGMLPGAFTVTSHIAVTAALAFSVFTIILITGIIKNGFGFLKLFVPGGVPMWLLPMIVVIELFSFIIRPVTLALRLFANMLAGHTMMKVIAGFIVMMGATSITGVLGSTVTFTFVTALSALEVLVAMLQAYVFAVLSCIYLNDVMHIHH